MRNAGCEVTLAGNGREAMDLLRLDLPDIVLTDLDMPVMDGLELVQAIRRDYPALPVILMTAMGSENVAAKALHHGAASYVRKRKPGQRGRSRPWGASWPWPAPSPSKSGHSTA